jgi:hypothetical protein
VNQESRQVHSVLSWTARIGGAAIMVVVVHAFMVWFAVPRPAAWYLGAIIYAGLIAVMFSRRSLVDKFGIYFVFVVVTVVGALTVCPCAGAHFVLAPIAGLMALALVHLVKFILPTASTDVTPTSAE